MIEVIVIIENSYIIAHVDKPYVMRATITTSDISYIGIKM